MTDFNQWKADLDAAEAAALGTVSTSDTPLPLSEEDKAVHDLCLEFAQEDLLASASDESAEILNEEPNAQTLPLATTARNSPAYANRGTVDFKPAFRRSIVATDSIEEAYMQLLGIADELCEECRIRTWNSSIEFVQSYIEQVRIAHDSGQMAGLASSVAAGLVKLKAGCEMSSHYAVKTQGVVADVGELFLLTALSAHELRRALSEVYDC